MLNFGGTLLYGNLLSTLPCKLIVRLDRRNTELSPYAPVLLARTYLRLPCSDHIARRCKPTEIVRILPETIEYS